MGKKQEVIELIYAECLKNNDFNFDNTAVKRISQRVGFGNQFDATKIDDKSILPKILKENNLFIIHLGKGHHKFVPNIDIGYHSFEEITDNEIINWNYRKSILNEYDSSESNILSVASNQRIIHDFLYEDIVANPRVYGSRRTKTSFSYNIGSDNVTASNLQIEIDLTMEHQGSVTVIEGKNGFPKDFAVYQIFHPFMYYKKLQEENQISLNEINCCYICRKNSRLSSTLRLHSYTFETENLDSIRLLKKAEYRLIRR